MWAEIISRVQGTTQHNEMTANFSYFSLRIEMLSLNVWIYTWLAHDIILQCWGLFYLLQTVEFKLDGVKFLQHQIHTGG